MGDAVSLPSRGYAVQGSPQTLFFATGADDCGPVIGVVEERSMGVNLKNASELAS